jgi:hypothetical protein
VTARQQWRWGAWAASVLAGFAWLEHGAYTRGHHPTLTAVLRYWLGIAPARPDRTIRAAVAAGAVSGVLVVLAVHLARVPADTGPQDRPQLRVVA